MLLRLASFCLLVVFSFSLSAKNYYVNKSGNDTLNGKFQVFTSGKDGPLKTITAAMNIVASGDTVNVGNGYYNERVIVSKNVVFFMDGVSVRSWQMSAPGIVGHVLGDSLEISDTITLNNGYVQVGTGVFFFLKYGIKIINAGKNSFVRGVCRTETSTGIGTMVFPIGVNQDYRPASVKYHQNIADQRVHGMEVFDGPAPVSGPAPNGIRNISDRHYWQFNRWGAGTVTDYIYVLNYDSISKDDHVYDGNQLQVVFSKNGVDWMNLTGSGTANRKGNAQAGFSIDTVGVITLANKKGGYNPMGSTAPFAKLASTGTCQGTAFSFFDKTLIIAPNTVTQWHWDFGDTSLTNDTAIVKNPTYNYSKGGTYNVRLVVKNNLGERDTFFNNVVVKAKPKAYFEHGNVCFSKISRFKDTSTIQAPDSITNRIWYLGDGNVASSKSISYIYGAAINYNVKLVVSTASGCKDSLQKTITIYPRPTPSFISSNACVSTNSSFVRIPISSPPDNQVTYRWYDNYVLKKTDTAYKAVLSGVGNHRITLTATSTNGCVDSSFATASVFGKPGVAFQLAPKANNDSIQCLGGNYFVFKPKITLGQGQSIDKANWSWGDGANTLLPDSFHIYNTEGAYNVKLRVTTDNGCADSFTRTYRVKGNLKLNFGKVGVCAPDSILFYDSGSVSSSAVTTHNWTFPSSSSTKNPTKLWNKSTGPFIVKLKAANAEGCIDSISKSYSFTQYPTFGWMLNGSVPFCKGDSIAVRADGGNWINWLIDNDTNRRKVFYKAGSYKVRSYSSLACSVLDSFEVILFPTPNIRTFSDTTIYRGSSANLRATGGVSYQWQPATYLNKTTGNAVISTPPDSISYLVVGTSINGCIDSSVVKVKVVDRPVVRIPNIITPNGDGENDYWVISDVKNIDRYDLSIADYAGKLVYSTSNYKNDWNAIKEGKLLPEGVYYYHLQNRRTGELYKGFIQVIR
ncbi:MAG: gliding motility-associated C-terminal domain-containing protein [Bacteroidia bacterium]|nr:gliding motility-associated C-terminal domain-containing protein [Bacteroidia bacterium]